MIAEVLVGVLIGHALALDFFVVGTLSHFLKGLYFTLTILTNAY